MGRRQVLLWSTSEEGNEEMVGMDFERDRPSKERERSDFI